MEKLIDDAIEIIKNETGFIITQYNFTELGTVLTNRIKYYNMNEENYLEYLKFNHSEVIFVVSCFTVHETSFYRHKNHFDRLKYDIIPELIRKNKFSRKIKILSAGCSTGEEPYTIAMILSEVIPDIDTWFIQILGTDINSDAIEKARKAEYGFYKMRNIDPLFIDKYFSKSSETKGSQIFTINDSIKRMVSFQQVNLNKKTFELPILQDTDIIFCENVIIYFNKENIQRLIQNFYMMLRKGGYLFLGYSETLNMIEHTFELSWWNDSFAYQRPDEERKLNESAPIQSENLSLNSNVQTLQISDTGINPDINRDELINAIITGFPDLTQSVPEILRTMLSNGVTDAEMYYLVQAEDQLVKKNYFGSSDLSRKALSVNQKSIDAHLLLARNYMELDMPDFAEFEIKTAIYINAKSSPAHFLYAKLHEKSGDTGKFIFSMQTTCQSYADNKKKLNARIYPLSTVEKDKIIDSIEIFIGSLRIDYTNTYNRM